MDIEFFRNYCINKEGVTEGFPFNNDALVFKVLGKMFVLTSIKSWEANAPSFNLKCDPDYAQELRATYTSITPGYHMNKKHWNTIKVTNTELSTALLLKLIDHSYNLVVAGKLNKPK